MNLVPGFGLTPQALNSARAALAPKGWAAVRRIIERSSMESPVVEKQKPALWAGSLNSGARTRTNAAGVEQRACRAGPEGVSRCAANNRTQFDGESGRRKAKTRLVGGFFK